jgi:hypothetical protein
MMIKFVSSPLYRYLPDKLALEIRFKNVFHRPLNLDNPKTFNEKLQWLKLYDRKPEYTDMVDKFAAKNYAANIIGEEHIIPTLGVFNTFDEIDFNQLPNQFVLKCTHGSGDVVICKCKEQFDKKLAKIKLTKALKTDYFNIAREWPYKYVKPRIIAERFIVDSNNKSLGINDYKFFCFDGEPKIMFVATNRAVDCRFDFFDMNFQHLPIYNIHKNADNNLENPKHFEEMKSIATSLSSGHSFMRVDLYEANNVIYFGEFTFYHAGGFSIFEPEKWDYKLGEWLKLPKNEQDRKSH